MGAASTGIPNRTSTPPAGSVSRPGTIIAESCLITATVCVDKRIGVHEDRLRSDLEIPREGLVSTVIRRHTDLPSVYYLHLFKYMDSTQLLVISVYDASIFRIRTRRPGRGIEKDHEDQEKSLERGSKFGTGFHGIF